MTTHGTIDAKRGRAIEAPAPYSSIIDLVAAADRAWFEEHPKARQYTRPYVPGEFWPMYIPAGSLVRVTYLGPGLRAREPLLIAPGDPALN